MEILNAMKNWNFSIPFLIIAFIKKCNTNYIRVSQMLLVAFDEKQLFLAASRSQIHKILKTS